MWQDIQVKQEARQESALAHWCRISVMGKKPAYSDEPKDQERYSEDLDRYYTRLGRLYDLAVRFLPVWKSWIKEAIPHIQGPRVLEVSFGTGYLLTQYADKFETCGLDYNKNMVSLAKRNLKKKGIAANIQRGTVEALPYKDEGFDTIVNTMAFSGYPDGLKAMSEMHRVLKKGGRLIIIDVNYPANGNWLGTKLTWFWARTGDIIRDLDELLGQFDFDYTDQAIGGFGSTHLYLCEKR
jgi:ubiquinone/menaquinone biosynthesis C-methylase UbiE